MRLISYLPIWGAIQPERIFIFAHVNVQSLAVSGSVLACLLLCLVFRQCCCSGAGVDCKSEPVPVWQAPSDVEDRQAGSLLVIALSIFDAH